MRAAVGNPDVSARAVCEGRRSGAQFDLGIGNQSRTRSHFRNPELGAALRTFPWLSDSRFRTAQAMTTRTLKFDRHSRVPADAPPAFMAMQGVGLQHCS